jgi:hypothetical protein
MSSATNLLSSTMTAIRDRQRDHRATRAAHKSLMRDLAPYTSPSDLNDLDAILARYSDTDTAEIRHILSGRR